MKFRSKMNLFEEEGNDAPLGPAATTISLHARLYFFLFIILSYFIKNQI